jgi:hypothetical protein
LEITEVFNFETDLSDDLKNQIILSKKLLGLKLQHLQMNIVLFYSILIHQVIHLFLYTLEEIILIRQSRFQFKS